MIGGHALTEALDILSAILAEYVFDCCPDHLLRDAPKLLSEGGSSGL